MLVNFNEARFSPNLVKILKNTISDKAELITPSEFALLK